MVVQRLAPWASLLASLLTLVYVTIQEWRQRESGSQSESETKDQTDGDSDGSVVQVVSRLDVFVYTTLAMLFVAALLHYLLLFTPVTFLAVPVWLFALFVILATGATQAMPGEDFEDKLDGQTGHYRPVWRQPHSPSRRTNRPAETCRPRSRLLGNRRQTSERAVVRSGPTSR